MLVNTNFQVMLQMLGFDSAIPEHKPFLSSNSFVVFAMCFGSFSFWNMDFHPKCKCVAD